MCRYRFRGSHCAHSAVDARECLGEDHCHVHSAERSRTQPALECSKEQWSGLYCAKYQRFHCTGAGRCSTPAEYLESLSLFRQTQWGH